LIGAPEHVAMGASIDGTLLPAISAAHRLSETEPGSKPLLLEQPAAVLVVEDDSAYSRFVRAALPALHFTATAATDLASATQLLRKASFDVILLDLSLPDSRGLATLSAVMSISNTAVVVMTGTDDDLVGMLCVQRGAQDFLVKGDLSPDLIVRSVRYAIERHGLLVRNTDLARRHEELIDQLSVALRRSQLLLEHGEILGANGTTEEEMCQSAVEAACNLVGCRAAGYWTPDEAGVLGELVTSTESLDLSIGTVSSWPAHAAISSSDASVAGQNAGSSPSGPDSLLATHDFASSICAPLTSKGAWTALIVAYDEGSREFAPEDQTALSALANQTSAAVRNIRLRTMLATSRRKAEALTKEQQAFTYTISHDLKGPLFSIQTLAAILGEDAGTHLSEAGTGTLQRITANVTMMEGLLHDLLDMARLQTLSPSFELVNMNELLSATIERMRPALDLRGVEVHIEANLPSLPGDSARLDRLFTNLVDNAVKYTPVDRTPVIRIGARLVDSVWEFKVVDNGVGIPQRFQGKIFEIFQRLPAAKEMCPDGTGIGLAIVAHVVDIHHGTCSVTSTENGGSTFLISLPATTEPRAITQPAASTEGDARSHQNSWATTK